MRITALAGGVGGARFLRGLLHHLESVSGPDTAPHDLTIVANTGDEIGIDEKPAIGKHCVAACHFQRGHGSGAECHGEVLGDLLCVESEAGHVLVGIVDANGIEQADRDQVFRLHQGLAQAPGS